jgi:hypothetical protein
MFEFRRRVLSFAAAAFGLACGIALLPFWMRPARPGQLPGFMTSSGFDSGASLHFFLSTVALVMLGAWLGRFLNPSQTWSFVTTTSALGSSVWIAIARPDLVWTAVPPLVVVAVCIAMRNVRQKFARRDAVLIPAALCTFMALRDIAPNFAFERSVIVAVCLVLFVRLALSLYRGLHPAYCFAPATAMGLSLQSHFNGYDQRHFGWAPLLLIVVSPFLFRLIHDTPATRRRFRTLVAFVIYPIVILAYSSATSMLAAEGKPHGDLFEDAHHLTVASEMLRGERPYRDIVVAHGLIQDCLLDYVTLRTGKVTAGRAIAVHGVVGSLLAVGGYAVSAAAAGSAHVGLFSYFLAAILGMSGGGIRPAPALIALALIVYAVRRREPRMFFLAGAAVAAAILTSLDFGSYSAIALVVALVRLRKPLAVRAAAAGVAVSAAITALGLVFAGVLLDSIRSTLGEIASLGPVYALSPFAAPHELLRRRFPPEVLAALFERPAFPFVFWTLTLIGTASVLTWRRRRTRATDRMSDAILIIAIWIVAAGLSYVERQHHYHLAAATPLIASLIALLFAKRRPAIAMSLIVVVLAIAAPTIHLAVIDGLRHQHGPSDASMVELTEIPRARGALYTAADAAIMRSVSKYLAQLPPDQTFFDFTNRGALYFLLDRDVPIRQLEVAFYERDEQQRDVIARLERNPHVVAALVPQDGDRGAAVDGVPNQVRAPLVWQYLQTHFVPVREEGNVVIWRRNVIPSVGEGPGRAEGAAHVGATSAPPPAPVPRLRSG